MTARFTLRPMIVRVAATLLLAAVAADALTAEPAPGADAAAPKPIAALQIAHAERGMLLGIARAGEQIVAVGGNGAIVRSADGKTWRQVPSPVDTGLNAVAFADAQHGWAVGHDAVILGTADGGATWSIQNFQPELYAPIFSILPLDAQKAIVVGAFGLIKATDDAGATWHDVNAPELSSDKLHLNAITRLRNGQLAVAGEHGLVGVSVDGSQWRRIPTPYEGSFFGVLPWGEKGAIVFGMRGNVYVSDDPGTASWKKIEIAAPVSFFGGEALSDGRLLLTGADSTLVILQPDGTVASTRKLRADGNESSLTGSLKLADSEIVIGESGVAAIPGH